MAFIIIRARRPFSCCSSLLTSFLPASKSAVEPAYLIYLNFYAATSLEMCAKPLVSASAYRNNLLQQAKAHYEKAAALLRTAEETALSWSRSSSAASSLPSLHSPSGSISSRAWTPDCGAMTPTSAVISRKSSMVQQPPQPQPQQQRQHQEPGTALTTTGDQQRQQQPLPRGRPAKKKVSFELPKDQSRWSFTLPEPVIRPDSPTLGFDDEYFAAGALRQELPEVPPPPPTTTATPSSKRSSLRQDPPFEAPTPSPPSMPSISEGEVLGSGGGSPIGSPSPTSSSGDDNDNEYPFFRSHHQHQHHSHHDPNADPESARALARYCETLTSLKTQVTSHMAALERLMEEPSSDDGLAPQQDEGQQQPQPQQQQAPDALTPTTSQMAASLHRMSLGATAARKQRSDSVATCSSSGGGGDDVGGGGEWRSRERQARIDRLRMNGWKRKRFDVSRYEELCDTVMEELDRRDG